MKVCQIAETPQFKKLEEIYESLKKHFTNEKDEK
jgi:hypothetical protein